jgi:hypothetical protein
MGLHINPDNCKTCRKIVSLFFIASIQHIMLLWYLVGYTQYMHRKACTPSCNMSIINIGFTQNLKWLSKFLQTSPTSNFMKIHPIFLFHKRRWMGMSLLNIPSAGFWTDLKTAHGQAANWGNPCMDVCWHIRTFKGASMYGNEFVRWLCPGR